MAGFQQAGPAGYHCPRFQELPSIPLYKDQVVEELNRYLAPLHCGEITATMVNNYVKVKAIPPTGKEALWPGPAGGAVPDLPVEAGVQSGGNHCHAAGGGGAGGLPGPV